MDIESKIGYVPQYVTVSDHYRSEELSTNMHRYIMFSAVFGLAAGSGVLLAGYFGQIPDPVVVFTGITIFAVIVLVNWIKKYTT